MSYTPSMDELREAWLTAEYEERGHGTSDDDLRAEFDRALAAHDAEVRASVESDPAKDERLVRYMAMVTPLGYQSALTVVQQMTLMIQAETEARQACVVAEEPDWETERVEEARIHYRYGVNSGTLAAWNTPESIALAVEDHERRTMGPIGVEKIETRTKITRISPWVPVKQEGADGG